MVSLQKESWKNRQEDIDAERKAQGITSFIEPIEEKWQKEFFERFGADKIWVFPSKENVETILDIWSFIENLLEQERKRMSEDIEQAKIGGTQDWKGAFNDGLDVAKRIINKN